MGTWLRDKIEVQGGDVMEVSRVYTLSIPGVYVTVKGPQDSSSSSDVMMKMRERGMNVQIMKGGSLKVKGGGRIKDWVGYDEGEWWIQDPSSTLPVLCMGTPPGLVVDLCCAPGGKLMQLSGYGIPVVGVELKGNRVRRVKENLKRVGMEHVDVHEGDGRVWRVEGGKEVKGVLVDAPCSSTGTGRRNSDVMCYEGGDLEELVELQKELVENAVGMVGEGGRIVYSTCSLLREENEEQVERFLKELPVVMDPVREDEVAGFEDCVKEDGTVRVWPGEDRDGFFVARFRKTQGGP
ncbi:hypothetical protein TrCOL_g7503 [Triparma columacea]|uniref:SAM-dependent MTase RsmB/NOP-type domain-containing protein n=1 Tax=Triparma columacea TaxID=722753 RepID=A0A9W7L4I9_9STRA|nr:hypothetical protein TrCOL_g7503 [Triparma columacea]